MKTNIVLTGLMGVGKTTLGKLLSHSLNMPFLDADEEIESQYGSISSLFDKGEGYFRDIEAQVIRHLSHLSNRVISTGGGVVLREGNMEALTRTGVVFYLTRPVEDILRTVDASTRPLLKNGAEALYRLQMEREPLYRKYCDHMIDVSDAELALKRIVSLWTKKDS